MRRGVVRGYLVIVLMTAYGWAVLAGGQDEEPARERAGDAPVSTQLGPVDGPEVTEADLVPMDDATAEALFRMGMMPFEERIPSEDFTLALLSGGELSLSEHRGEIVFLNFWATWCPPCREEMPSMQALYDELHDEGLEMLAVNVLESEDVAREFIDEFGFTYPVPMDRNGRVMLRYGVRAYPTTYIIDREGFVIGVRPGFHEWNTPEVIEQMRILLAAE